MFCRSCGKEIPTAAAVCPFCDAAQRILTEGAAETPAVSSAPPPPAAPLRDPQGRPRPQTMTAGRPPIAPMPYPARPRRGAAFVGRIVFCVLGMLLGIAVVGFALGSGSFDVNADLTEAAGETAGNGLTAYIDAALRSAVQGLDRVAELTTEMAHTVALAAKALLTLSGSAVTLFFGYLLCQTLDRRD